MIYLIQKILRNRNIPFEVSLDNKGDFLFNIPSNRNFFIKFSTLRNSISMSFIEGSFPGNLMKEMINNINKNYEKIYEKIQNLKNNNVKVEILIDNQKLLFNEKSGLTFKGNSIGINLIKFFDTKVKINSDNVYRKIMTKNDVGETGSHQSGILIKKNDKKYFPELNEKSRNPEEIFNAKFKNGSEVIDWKFRFIHYNSKLFSKSRKGRDEYRLTGTEGYKIKSLLDSVNIYAGDSIAFRRDKGDSYVFEFERDKNNEFIELWLPKFIYFFYLILPIEIEGESEGKKIKKTCSKYERSKFNRNVAIDIHGYVCGVCKFEFEKVYGEIGREFVEIHHITPVSEMGEKSVDPLNDLIPLCSNCHSMIHKKSPPYQPYELKKIIEN